MFEQTKSSVRRSKEKHYVEDIFVGIGIDIGAGNDSLSKNISLFPNITSIRGWDLPDGDAQYLETIADNTFDFIHSSHCLEHMVDPHVAIKNWIRVCKSDGYLILTVPDETLYEHNMWPSKFNTDHKWSFTLNDTSVMPKSINVYDFLVLKNFDVRVVDVFLVDNGYNPSLSSTIDQTMLPDVECAIEIILQKR